MADHPIRITSALLEDAYVVYATTDHVLDLVLESPRGGLPLWIRQPCAQDDCRIVAQQAKTRLLKRGDIATVYADGPIRPRSHPRHGSVLELTAVADVIPHRTQPVRQLADA